MPVMLQHANTLQQKATYRQQLRRRRATLSPGTRKRAAFRLARRLLGTGILRRGGHLGVYLAAGSELSLAPFMALAQQHDCTLYAPIVPPHGRIMRFAALTEKKRRWRCNRFGILEFVSRPTVAAPTLHTVLVPLIGFDAQCRRLGQGGGFYDNSFTATGWRRPRLIGIAFECQRVAALPLEAHDQALSAVITEKRTYRPPLAAA